MLNKIKTYAQYCMPQQLLTLLMGKLAEIRNPRFKRWMIQRFIQTYKVDMSLALEENIENYPTFNDFFIRQLKPELRPITPERDAIASPVDGTIAQIGYIKHNQLLQVKEFYFDLETLVGQDSSLAQTFYDGSFVTLYLAPHDYHRVHMPIQGSLEKTIYVPGKLFSVNRISSELIPNLYSRNERLISVFATQAGPMAVIMVGAMIVGSISTAWEQKIKRDQKGRVQTFDHPITLDKGEEIGYFSLGSTVILLFAKDRIKWAPHLKPATPIQFGQFLGNFS